MIERKQRGMRGHKGQLCSYEALVAFFEGAGEAGGASAAAEGAGAAGATAGGGTLSVSTTGSLGGFVETGGVVNASAGLSVGDVLSGAVQGFGTLAQIRAGEMNSAMLKGQARDMQLKGKAEFVQGLQEANDSRDRLIRTLAQQNAAAGASGLSLDSGGLDRGREVAIQKGGQQIETAKAGGIISESARRSQAYGYQIAARSERLSGQLKGGFGLLNMYDRTQRRGSVPDYG